MEDLQNQLDKLCIDEKPTFNAFIEFINNKYPEKEYPIIYDLYDDDKKWLTSNGGSWHRNSKKTKYKIFLCCSATKIKYNWNYTDEEESHIIDLVSKLSFTDRNKNQNNYIGIYSHSKNKENINRPIREDIKQIIKVKQCLHCGKSNDTVVDHKNDLYNDPRVLDIKTQTIDDFQPLCNGCNLIKRAYNVKMLKTGKRFDACELPLFKHLGVSYTSGNETFDVNDVNTLQGVYWTDIEDFIRKTLIRNITIYNSDYY